MNIKLFLKNIWEDKTGKVLMIYPFMMSAIGIWLVGFNGSSQIAAGDAGWDIFAEMMSLALIMVYIPMLIAFMLMMTFVDDKENNIAASMNTSPFSATKYLLWKTIVMSIYCAFVMVFTIVFIGIVKNYPLDVMILTSLATIFSVVLVPAIAFPSALFANDRIQAMGIMKFGGIIAILGGGPIVLNGLFVQGVIDDYRWVEYLAFIIPTFAPLMLIMIAASSAIGGDSAVLLDDYFMFPWWVYMVVGLVTAVTITVYYYKKVDNSFNS